MLSSSWRYLKLTTLFDRNVILKRWIIWNEKCKRGLRCEQQDITLCQILVGTNYMQCILINSGFLHKSRLYWQYIYAKNIFFELFWIHRQHVTCNICLTNRVACKMRTTVCIKLRQCGWKHSDKLNGVIGTTHRCILLRTSHHMH